MSNQENAATPEALPFIPPSVEELGQMLPHYDIHFLIASGGMGAVYRGCQKDLDRMVAIKILPPEAGNDAESLNRFRSEARAMAKLNHPNIVSIYDFGAMDGQCYFVMEYVEGQNVHEMITQGSVTPVLAQGLLSQVCDALAYAHSKGIIHGDIKPSNIVVDGDGMVKLLDFGLARLMEHEQSDSDVEWVPMGTPEYAAPELYERGAVADPRTDIYALGVVFYEMLMRTVPQGTFALPSTSMKVDGRVDDIIIRCLRPEPAHRFQTATEIRQVLEDIRTGKPMAANAQDANRGSRQVTIVRPSARRGQVRSSPTKVGGRPTSPNALGRPTGVRTMDRLSKIESEAKAKQNKLFINGAILLVIAIVVGVLAISMMSSEKPTPEPTEQTKDGKKKKDQDNISFAPPKPPKDKPKAEPREEPTVVAPEPPKEEPKEEPKEVAVTPPPPTPPMQEPTTPPTEVSPPVTPPTTLEPYPSLAKLKTDYTARYKAEIQDRLSVQEKDVGDKYKLAMNKLEQELLARNDATAVLQIRTELERFGNTGTPPAANEIVRNERVADLQRKLGGAFTTLRRTQTAPIAKLNSEFSEALARLTNALMAEGKKEEAEATKAFREQGAKMPDYVGTYSGFVTPPESVQGAIEEGNVALEKNGAVGEAPKTPGGMIDGSHERDGSSAGTSGSVFVVTLVKVYQLEQIMIHLSRRGNYNYVVEVSVDGKRWKEVEDRSKGEWSGVQTIDLKPQPVRSIRVTAKTANDDDFRIYEIGAFCVGHKAPENWGKSD